MFVVFVIMSLIWVRDADGNCEISSANHLRQLMNKGTLYTDEGDSPTDYFQTSYIQTSDIDLLNDSTDIKAIGSQTDPFNGSYDGAEHRISNYSYVDPNFNTSNEPERMAGLFGRVTGFSIKNMRLDGVWTIEGYAYFSGFLAGHVNIAGGISNIECDFSQGTFFDTTHLANSGYIGGVLGYCKANSLTGVTLRGSVDFRREGFVVGGIFGYVTQTEEFKFVRNLATFPSGLRGASQIGGICGYCSSNQSISGMLNAMTGDIIGGSLAGGIFAFCIGSSIPSTVENVVNSMTGNISSVGDTNQIGGIFGQLRAVDSCQYLFNYMTGNITGTSSKIAGLVGSAILQQTASISNCVNAMNGTVVNGLFGEVDTNSNLITNTVTNTDYGLTFTTDSFSHGSPTELTVPYNDAGNAYGFEFVYGSLPASLLDVRVRSTNIPVEITPIPDAVGYRLTIEEGSTGVEVLKVSGTKLKHNILGIVPETQYTIRLYADTGSGYELSEETSVTSLVNTAVNYDLTDFEVDGLITLGNLGADMNMVIGDLLGTGDVVGISLLSGKPNTNVKSSFIKIGETLRIKDVDSALMPFSTFSGSGQNVSVTLSDDVTTVPIVYDETSGSLTISSVTYNAGDSFVLDGKKVTVYDV